MPPIHVAQRPRYFNLCIKNAQPQHGHIIEYVISIVNIVVQLAFLWGSILFLSSNEDDLKWGDALFIVGSVITFLFAIFHLIESQAHWKDYAHAEREDRIEFWETMMFFVAGLIFMLGSFGFWPGIYDWWYAGQTETVINNHEEYGESVCAYLFTAGSVLFLIASMFNAIGLGMNKEEAEENQISVVTHYLHVVGLMASQLGSVLFVAGSLMYRPAIGNACPDFTARYEGAEQVNEEVATHACETTAAFGTHLYIYGSGLYALESILCLITGILKGNYSNSDKVGHKEAKEDEEDGSGVELMDQS